MSLDKTLTWLINGWFILVILFNVVAVIGLMYAAPTFWAGIGKIQAIYSPFNIWNFLVEAIIVFPAFVLQNWRDRRRPRAQRANEGTIEE